MAQAYDRDEALELLSGWGDSMARYDKKISAAEALLEEFVALKDGLGFTVAQKATPGIYVVVRGSTEFTWLQVARAGGGILIGPNPRRTGKPGTPLPLEFDALEYMWRGTEPDVYRVQTPGERVRK